MITETKTGLDYETLKRILDNSHDEIYVIDANGIVLYVNNACERHYGVPASQIIGKKSDEISERNLWAPRVSPIALQRRRSFTLEQRTCTGKTLLTTATPIFDNHGHLDMVIENSRDITESEGIKAELEKSMQAMRRYKSEIDVLRKKELAIPDLMCESKKMEYIMELALRIAAVDSPVLLLGESGTGKSMMAKYIHKNSTHSNSPFITVNCASIPSDLMESELFGYSRGAFTGADEKGKIGLIELASEGTLFLDEIGELPMRMQAKLLQVLQENQYFKVGGREIKHVNCRIIAATNRNVQTMIEKGEFREDLYYRLNIFELELPPLRERREEISPLIDHFLSKFNNKYKVYHELSPKCVDLFQNYNWPGNIRELVNIIERLVVVSKDMVIDDFDLPKTFHNRPKPQPQIPAENSSQNNPQSYTTTTEANSLDDAVSHLEKDLVTKTYRECGSSYEVAKVLKISQSKASRLIRKYCAV